MDMKELIVASTRQIMEGVKEAQQALKDEVSIGLPTRMELEIGITSSYEIANYDDVRIANLTISVPFTTAVIAAASPASAALEEPKKAKKRA